LICRTSGATLGPQSRETQMQYRNPGRFLVTYRISVSAFCHALTEIRRFRLPTLLRRIED
jgi:hypothetical protein